MSCYYILLLFLESTPYCWGLNEGHLCLAPCSPHSFDPSAGRDPGPRSKIIHVCNLQLDGFYTTS